MDLFDLLDQDAVWIDREGATHEIADMEPRYCGNVVAFLERRASAIAERQMLDMIRVPMPDTETMAYDAAMSRFESELDALQADPVTWLRSTPLIGALRTRAGEVA